MNGTLTQTPIPAHRAASSVGVDRSLRTAFTLSALLGFLAQVTGLVVALIQNVPDAQVGGPARDTWLSGGGTAYSAPLFYLVTYAAFLVLSARDRRFALLGTIVVAAQAALADLSAPGDWSGTVAAFKYHFNVVAYASTYTLLAVNVVIVALALVIMGRRIAKKG